MNLKVNDVDILSWGFHREMLGWNYQNYQLWQVHVIFLPMTWPFQAVSSTNKLVIFFFFLLGQSMVWLVVRSRSQACAFQTWVSWLVLFDLSRPVLNCVCNLAKLRKQFILLCDYETP